MTHSVALNFADGKTFFINVHNDELLLNAAVRQGITLPLDCREGVCGTCQGLCESGAYEQEYVDEDALSEQDLLERKILACQTRVQSNASFYFDHDSSFCQAGDAQTISTTVKKVELVSDTTAILHLDASQHKPQLKFLPGQYARLQIPGSDEWRSYSFAHSSNSENQLQFIIRLLPQGVMSDYLRSSCQIGDHIPLQAPLGSFYLRAVERPLVFVAGGTGLSAFLGMLDDLVEEKTSVPIQLYYGVNRENDLCEQQRLEHYKAHLNQFEYHPIISKPQAEWSGKIGYIHEHFDTQALAEHACDIYMCGPPPMIESVKQWLNLQSFDHHRIYSEKFLQSQGR